MERQLDLEHRLTATEDREKANTRRIEKLENVVEAIHDMSNTMVRLVEQIKTTNENVQHLKVKVDAIEQEPAQNFKSLKKTVITCIVTAVVSGIVGALIGLIF
jgi:chromosome segregation ATPase